MPENNEDTRESTNIEYTLAKPTEGGVDINRNSDGRHECFMVNIVDHRIKKSKKQRYPEYRE